MKIIVLISILLLIVGCDSVDENEGIDSIASKYIESRYLSDDWITPEPKDYTQEYYLDDWVVYEKKDWRQAEEENHTQPISEEEMLQNSYRFAKEIDLRKKSIISQIDTSVCRSYEEVGVDNYHMYREDATNDELVKEPFFCFTGMSSLGVSYPGDPKPNLRPRQLTGQEWCDGKLSRKEQNDYGGCGLYLRNVVSMHKFQNK